MPILDLPTRPTIKDIHTLYRDNDVKVTDVVNYFYEKIEAFDDLTKALLRVTKESALKKAHIFNQVLSTAKTEAVLSNTVNTNDTFVQNINLIDFYWFDDLIHQFPLFGIPFVAKDNILVEGELVTSASKILDGFIAPYSSTVYKRLETAGAILIGQSNMDEFAFGSSTEKSAYQVTRNPFDPERVPGGTSGGSAAAVAAGMVPIALGTDTGGSIRQPSSFCGTVGVRPSYGLVSRYGVMPSTSSFDQVGPITNCVLDNALVLSILEGKDLNDQTSLDTSKSALNNFLDNPDFGRKFNRYALFKIFLTAMEAFANTHGIDTGDENLALAESYLSQTYTTKPKLGIPKDYFGEGLSSETREALESLIEKLKLEFEIEEVELPMTKYALSVYYILQFVESTANLERYDGIRFGPQISGRSELYFQEREEFLGSEVKRRIMLGTYTSSAGYYDAYYNKACQVRELLRQDFLKAFQDIDVLLMPTSPFPAFKIGSKDNDPLTMYLADIMTISQPPARLPCLVIPVAIVDYEGSKLPVGVQLVGPEMSEDVLYRVGCKIEKITNFT